MQIKLKNVIILILINFILISCAAPSTAIIDIDDYSLKIEEEIQKELVLKQNLKYQTRIDNVAYRLFVDNKELCQPDVEYITGLHMLTISDYTQRYQKAAVKVHNLDEGLTVTLVVKNSSAFKAGIKVGDKILSITDSLGNDIIVGEGKKSIKLFRKTFNNLENKKSLNFNIIRNQELKSIPVQLDFICNYDVVLSGSDALPIEIYLFNNILNTSADGSSIYINKRMLRFVENDNELSLVIAHEMAHNAMNHIDKTQTNRAMGSFVDIAAAAYGVNTQGLFALQAGRVFSKEFESEADYVSLYYLARSDINFQDAGNFWRRMDAEKDFMDTGHATTHPTSPQRFLKIDKAIGEINNKIANNKPLIPNYKR
tara:strand:- start:1902 stop:3011 length:1110 start_codon:yes stop_codon:yes gene_type:complete